MGTLAGGTTSARNAGLTNLNTTTIADLRTPGSTFDGTYAATNAVGWGFDEGGFVYRDGNSNPVYDPATLTAVGPNPEPTVVVGYGGTLALGDAPLHSYGYHVNAVGDGKLDGRPAVVDQPYGAGHAVMIGFDPFYRSWKEQDERLVLNAVLLPGSAPVAAPAARQERGPAPSETGGASEPEAPVVTGTPVPKAERMSTTVSRPLKANRATDRDVRITVARSAQKKLRSVVKRARLNKATSKKVRYVLTRKTVTLVIKGIRTNDEHGRSQ